jgi:hypothetical protein
MLRALSARGEHIIRRGTHFFLIAVVALGASSCALAIAAAPLTTEERWCLEPENRKQVARTAESMGFGHRAGVGRSRFAPNGPGPTEPMPLGQWREEHKANFKAACRESYAVEFGPPDSEVKVEPADDTLAEKLIIGTIPLALGGLGGAVVSGRVRTKERLQQRAAELDQGVVDLGTAVGRLAQDIHESIDPEKSEFEVLDRVLRLRGKLAALPGEAVEQAYQSLRELIEAVGAATPRGTEQEASKTRASSIENAWVSARVEVTKVIAAARREAAFFSRRR